MNYLKLLKLQEKKIGVQNFIAQHAVQKILERQLKNIQDLN